MVGWFLVGTLALIDDAEKKVSFENQHEATCILVKIIMISLMIDGLMIDGYLSLSPCLGSTLMLSFAL